MLIIPKQIGAEKQRLIPNKLLNEIAGIDGVDSLQYAFQVKTCNPHILLICNQHILLSILNWV
jgi:hypothetical protein